MGASKSKPVLTEGDITFLEENTQFERRTIKELFDGFQEECPSGRLEEPQFRKVYGLLFPDGNADEFCRNAFRTFDADSNGYVDFREFLLALDMTSNGSAMDKLEWAFKLYDVDGNGVIDQKEIMKILNAVYQLQAGSQKFTPEETVKEKTERIFDKLNRDIDEVITRDEFMAGYTISEDGEYDERSQLLGNPVTNSIPSPYTEDNLYVPNSLPRRKADEQTLVDRILQETTASIIDVAALEAPAIDQHEFPDRSRQYHAKIQETGALKQWVKEERRRSTVSTATPLNPTAVLCDVPHPEKPLSMAPLSKEDHALILGATLRIAEGVRDIRVHPKEDLVLLDEFAKDVTPVSLAESSPHEDCLDYLDWTAISEAVDPSLSSRPTEYGSVLPSPRSPRPETPPGSTPRSSICAAEPTRVPLLQESVPEPGVIFLTETGTQWLLELPSVFVEAGSEEARLVEKANAQYGQLCIFKGSSDRYVEHNTQTLAPPAKTKSTQTAPLFKLEAGSQASAFELYDEVRSTQKAVDYQKTSPDNVERQLLGSLRTLERYMGGNHNQGCGVGEANFPGGVRVADSHYASLRFLVFPLFWTSYRVYRDFEADGLDSSWNCVSTTGKGNLSLQPKDAADESKVPLVQYLWSYLWPKGEVTQIAVSPVVPHLLATCAPDAVLCWSAKSPLFPERLFSLGTLRPISLVFCPALPSLLAVGTHQGEILLFQVDDGTLTTPDPTSMPRCRFQTSWISPSPAHRGPVWQLHWLSSEKDLKLQELLSCAVDGRISIWRLDPERMALDLQSNILHEKPSSPADVRNPEGSLTTVASILSAAPVPSEDMKVRQVLIGDQYGQLVLYNTESKSRPVEVRKGHMLSVFAVRFSPFSNDIFMSCSGDWTLSIWHTSQDGPCITLDSTRPVLDCAWLPSHSTYLLLLLPDSLELWDIATSTLHPRCTVSASSLSRISGSPEESDSRFTCLKLLPHNQCVLLGDSTGRLHTLRIRALPPVPENQRSSLENVLRSTSRWQA
ncbi:unnamed protein product [Cyprideis torosa]|uniref:Dynein axonemal intermediate chain 4 n=1 Tax=Cyprideis torosa TaxID=163714 RepID=A0A7R8WC73_9CRUS|nr:unnamed protein product [Cyprideis torosa]CAG0892977.1 unnamed protein product [Cyprideis torosa]